MLKTISCGDVRTDHVGTTVTLAGWVHRRRDHGSLIFIDLRDREGLVQIVFNPELAADAHGGAVQLRNEWVIQVSGQVMQRPEGTENPNLATGELEIAVDQITIRNESKTPPFNVNDESEVDEIIRLKYRYLDLRRAGMRDNLIARHKVVKFIRDFLDDQRFLEIETPILTKSTPEGARDFLVPSRVHPGQFYALPQSPQQLKQLLMVAGVEKYFQIARCFRDEDLRADRQLEHTQLDQRLNKPVHERIGRGGNYFWLSEMVHICLVGNVSGIGESRSKASILFGSVPAHVVQVQVGDKHRVHLSRVYIVARQVVHQLASQAADVVDGSGAVASVDKDSTPLGPN